MISFKPDPVKRGVLTLLLLAFFSLAAEAAAAAEEKPVIKVGVLLSLSGGLEQWCSYIRKGMELALDQTAPAKLEVVFEDDKSVDRKAVAAAAHKLIEMDNVHLVAVWTGSVLPVLAPIAVRAKTPLLVGAYDHNVAEAGDFVFGAFVNYRLLPREIARFLVQAQGARRLALIMAADDWSLSFERPFKEEALGLGAEIVFTETVKPDETDTRSLILRLKRERIQAVLAPLYASSLYAFLKQARTAGFTGLIHVGDGMFEEDLKIAGPSAEGVYASQMWLESPELNEMLKRRYGAPADSLQLGLVASGYDWVRHLQGLAAQLAADGKPISRLALRDGLKTFRSRGFLGELMFGVPPESSGEIMVVVKDGRYVPAQREEEGNAAAKMCESQKAQSSLGLQAKVALDNSGA